MDSKIVVLGFDNQYGAEGMLEEIRKYEKDGLISLEDAVIANRGISSDVELKQMQPKTGHPGLKGGGVGLLAGILLGGPILGLAAGAGIGAIIGASKDYGMDDRFIAEISEGLKPESSALFLLIREAKGEEFQDKLSQYEARVLVTTLPPDREEALRDLLEGKS